MIDIITHTPKWVFILFFFLLILGLVQTKDRDISFVKAMILPFVMVVLSFLGAVSAFGLTLYTIISWALGLKLGSSLNYFLKLPRGSYYKKDEKLFFIKGSFIPLILIMGIFFTKYFVGVVTAKEFSFIYELETIAIISLIYGFFSGMFFGRFLVLRKLKKELI